MGAGSSTRAVTIAEPEPWRSKLSREQEQARTEAFQAKRKHHYGGMGASVVQKGSQADTE
jgi:hypothetical protein